MTSPGSPARPRRAAGRARRRAGRGCARPRSPHGARGPYRGRCRRSGPSSRRWRGRAARPARRRGASACRRSPAGGFRRRPRAPGRRGAASSRPRRPRGPACPPRRRTPARSGAPTRRRTRARSRMTSTLIRDLRPGPAAPGWRPQASLSAARLPSLRVERAAARAVRGAARAARRDGSQPAASPAPSPHQGGDQPVAVARGDDETRRHDWAAATSRCGAPRRSRGACTPPPGPSGRRARRRRWPPGWRPRWPPRRWAPKPSTCTVSSDLDDRSRDRAPLVERDPRPHPRRALDAGAGHDPVADRRVRVGEEDERARDHDGQVDAAPACTSFWSKSPPYGPA